MISFLNDNSSSVTFEFNPRGYNWDCKSLDASGEIVKFLIQILKLNIEWQRLNGSAPIFSQLFGDFKVLVLDATKTAPTSSHSHGHRQVKRRMSSPPVCLLGPVKEDEFVAAVNSLEQWVRCDPNEALSAVGRLSPSLLSAPTSPSLSGCATPASRRRSSTDALDSLCLTLCDVANVHSTGVFDDYGFYYDDDREVFADDADVAPMIPSLANSYKGRASFEVNGCDSTLASAALAVISSMLCLCSVEEAGIAGVACPSTGTSTGSKLPHDSLDSVPMRCFMQNVDFRNLVDEAASGQSFSSASLPLAHSSSSLNLGTLAGLRVQAMMMQAAR
jgi:hypothetical protein